MNKNKTSMRKEKIINSSLFFMLLLSIYFQKFYIYIGFAFKPYMIILSIITCICIIRNIKIINRIFLYEYLFLLFIFYSLIRGFFSVDKISYIRLTVTFVLGIFIYFFSSNFTYKLECREIIENIFYSSTIFLILSLCLYIFFDPIKEIGGILDGKMYRLNGTVVDPNFFVLFSSLIYFVSLHKITKKEEKKYYVSYLLSLICILLTFSRGGLLAIIIFTILYSFKYLLKIKTFMVIVFLLILLSIFFYFIVLKMGHDLNYIWQERTAVSNGSGRLEIWKNSLEVLKINPVFGIGLYNFSYYNKLLFYSDLYIHNTFLEVFVENGVIGGLLFSFALTVFIFDKPKNDIEKAIKYCILTQLAMLFFLSGITNEFIYLCLGLYKGIKFKSSKSKCKITTRG